MTGKKIPDIRMHIRRMRLPMTTSRKFRGDYRIFRHDLQLYVKACLQILYYASCRLAIKIIRTIGQTQY